MKSAGGILRAVERASSPAAGAVASEGGSSKRGWVRSRAWRAAKAAKAASVVVGVAGVVATGLGALGIGPLSVPISGARSYLADKWAGAGTGVGEGWPAHVQRVTVAACIGDLKSELAKAKSAQTTPTEDNVAYDDQIRLGAEEHGIREHAELFREMLVSIYDGAPNPLGLASRTPIMDRVVFRCYTTNAESGRIFTLFVSPIHAAWHGVEREAMYPQYAARELYAGFESFRRDHGAGTWDVTVCVDNEELGVYTRAFADAARVVTYRQDDWAYPGPNESMSRVKKSAVLARDETAVGLCVDRCHGKRRVGLMVLSEGAPGGAAAKGKHSVDLGVVDDDNQPTHEASVVRAWLRGETRGVHATGGRQARADRADELFVGTIAGRWAVNSHRPLAGEGTDYSDAWVVRDARLGLVDAHAATLVFVKVPHTNRCVRSEMEYVARAVEAGLDAMIAEGIRVAIIAPSSCFNGDGADSFASIVDAALDGDYKSPRAPRVVETGDVVADGRATNPSESVRRHFFAEVLIPTLVGLSSAASRSSRFGCDVPRRFV